ncbi:hypothetical protein VTN31DRAFT_404 [Thermomyces dupontii]|uniref:uncharacterized protein n=1 Tax=Talaromyces thermophilus TaxID=28565 RepID=UPI00374407D6
MAENPGLSNEEDQRQLEYLLKQLADKDKQLKEEAEARKEAEDAQKRAEAETWPTTFEELLRYSNELLSRQLLVGTRAESTRGTIAARREKLCPEELCHWSDFPREMTKIFDDVCRFLKPADKAAPRLFHSSANLNGLSKYVVAEPLRSEADFNMYEYMAVVQPVVGIIQELSKFDDARVQFQLPNGVRFHANHAGALETKEGVGDDQSGTRPWPDLYCFHRTDDNAECLLTTVELKPPHKLDVQCLRAGLRDMDFVEEVVMKDTIPTDEDGKTRSTAETRTGVTLAQEYNVMIEEGVEFSYISNGFAYVFLHVPKNEFWKLYYFICEPNVDVNQESDEIEIEKTSIARVLCFCLMCCRSTVRDQKWRNEAKKSLRTWGEHLDGMWAKISSPDAPRTPSSSDHQSSESEYLPSSPPSERVAGGPSRHGEPLQASGGIPSSATPRRQFQ